MGELYDQNKHWHYYLTRPFSVFGASLWHHWYSSLETKTAIGAQMADVLFVEESRDVFRQYRTFSELWRFAAKIGFRFLLFRYKNPVEALQHGIDLNKQAESFLKKGASSFGKLEEAVDFYTRLALYTTILPYILYELAKWVPFGFRTIKNLSELLRAKSYYPQVYQEIIIPLAQARLGESGISDAESALGVITYNELIAGDFGMIEARVEARNKNQYFVYQIVSGKPSIRWTSDPLKIISLIEGARKTAKAKQISGTVAYPGKVNGRVKVVLSSSDWSKFSSGDILVAPSTNPDLMPLILKSAAIVTNEGGMLSHAAIISRELKIPCIIGTKTATKVFKDGDMVEVDANKGVVRKI